MPSATRVSKEKLNILDRVFSTKFVVFPEVTEVTKVTKVGGMSDYQTPQKEDEVDRSLDERGDLNDGENVAPTSQLF